MRKKVWELVIRAGPLLLLLLLSVMNVRAASFDCAKATTKVEKMICADMELSKMDEEMAATYKAAQQDEKQVSSIRHAQKAWLKERNRCVDTACMRRAYEGRLQRLVSTNYQSQYFDVVTKKQMKNNPNSPKPLTQNYLKSHGFIAEPFNFKLTKGHGVPVCEAYLKRLNNTDFDNAPFCGRPEDDSVPGFKRLNRVQLSAEEMRELILKVHGFQDSQDQEQWRIQYKNIPNKGIVSLGVIHSDMNLNRLSAWRYDPPVDIDNDGQPDNILIWYEGGFSCGSINNQDPDPAHGTFTINVLDSKNQYIDEARTRELFEHPKGWFEVESKSFRYIGIEMGIFAYEGKYYFDTFYNGWGDFEGRRRDSRKMVDTLAVFLRKDKKTEQVCEYYWLNSKNINPGRN